MMAMISSSYDASCEEEDIRDVNPGFDGGDCCLEVFGQSSASSQAGKCALNHPSMGQKFKTFRLVCPLDAFQGELPNFLQSAFELRASITAISKDTS